MDIYEAVHCLLHFLPKLLIIIIFFGMVYFFVSRDEISSP